MSIYEDTSPPYRKQWSQKVVVPCLYLHATAVLLCTDSRADSCEEYLPDKPPVTINSLNSLSVAFFCRSTAVQYWWVVQSLLKDTHSSAAQSTWPIETRIIYKRQTRWPSKKVSSFKFISSLKWRKVIQWQITTVNFVLHSLPC